MADFYSSFGSPYLDSSRTVNASRRAISGHVSTQIGTVVNVTFCEFHGHLTQTYMVKLLDSGSDQVVPCRKISPQSSLDGVGDFYPLEEGDPVLVLFKEGRADVGYILGGFTSEGEYLKFLVQGEGEAPGHLYDSGLGNVIANPPSIHPDRVGTPDAFMNIISSRALLGDYQDPSLGNAAKLEEQSSRRSQPASLEIKDKLGNYAQYAKGDIILYSDKDLIFLSTKEFGDECVHLAKMVKYYNKLIADLERKFLGKASSRSETQGPKQTEESVEEEEDGVSETDTSLESSSSGTLRDVEDGSEVSVEEESADTEQADSTEVSQSPNTDLAIGGNDWDIFSTNSEEATFSVRAGLINDDSSTVNTFDKNNLEDYSFSSEGLSFSSSDSLNQEGDSSTNTEDSSNEGDSKPSSSSTPNEDSSSSSSSTTSSSGSRQIDRLKALIGYLPNPDFHQYATNNYHIQQLKKLVESTIKEVAECKKNLAAYREAIQRMQNGTHMGDYSNGDSSPNQESFAGDGSEYKPRDNECGKTLVQTIKDLPSIVGKTYGSGTCYEGVADAIDYAGLGKLGGDCQINGPNSVANNLAGYTAWAIHFANFFNENPSNLAKFEIRNLRDDGIVDPNDSRVPPGAVIVVASNKHVAHPAGDINIKTDDGQYLNPRSMTNWMTDSAYWEAEPNLVAGIFVDASGFSFTSSSGGSSGESQGASEEEIQKRIAEDEGRTFASKYGNGIYEVEYNYDKTNWTDADVKAKPIDSGGKPIVVLPIQYSEGGIQPGALGRGREWTLEATAAMKRKLEAKGFYVLTPDVHDYYKQTGDWNEAHQALEFYTAAVSKGNSNVQTIVMTADAAQGGAQLLVPATRSRDNSWEGAIESNLKDLYSQNGLKMHDPSQYLQQRGQAGYGEGTAKGYHPLIERVGQYNPRVGILEVGTLEELLQKGGSMSGAAQYADPIFNELANAMAQQAGL